MRHLSSTVPSSLAVITLLACGSTSADPILGAGTGGSAGSAGSAGSSGGSGGSGATGGSSGNGGSAGAPINNPACNSADAPAAVVTCNLPPDVALIGVDDSYLFAVSVGLGGGSTRFLRVDKQNGETLELYESPMSTSLSAENVARRAVLDGARILWATYVDIGAGVSSGLVSISTAGAATPQTVSDGNVAPGSYIAVDDSYAYVGYESGPGGVYTLGRVGKSGGFVQEIASVGGRPHVVRDGHLYFSQLSELKRMPVAGGTVEAVVTLPEGASDHLAFDETHVYYAEGAPEPYGDHRLHRTSLTSPFSGEVVATIADQGAEEPFTALGIDGDWLYYKRFGGLTRVKKSGGSSEPQQVWGDFGLPMFDSQFVFVSYARGGSEGPIEGVIVKRTK